MRSRLVDILLILVAGIAIYSQVSTVFFCGYDDFADIHRAVFEDGPHPARIFTTTHFGTSKYRPLQRGLTWLCWHLGGGSALPFRTRNLFFHLAAALLVYGIALSCLKDRLAAVTAGLLFCVAPLANQSVVAAIWTNTTAYAVLLGSFLLFLRSLQTRSRAALGGSLALALTGLFLYESVIVVFGMMIGYLIVWHLRGQTIERSWLKTWIAGCALVLLVFTAIRLLVVTSASARTPPGEIVHNALVYSAALLLPIDPVLSNALFGSALPPNIHPSGKVLTEAFAGVVVVLLLGFAVRNTWTVRSGLKRLNRPLAIFLVSAIGMALTPVLVFTPHASETYLYLPAALFSILLVLVLRAFLQNKAAYLIVVSLFLCSFAAGTWIRNQRVARCGDIAQTVLAQMPVAHWAQGQWRLFLANAPGEILQPRYGIYGYDGLSTIDPSEPGIRSAEMALQVESGNEQLQADVVPIGEMDGKCSIPETCFFVSRNGQVKALPPQ